MSTTSIFNQYYFDVLRKAREAARLVREESKDARDFLRAAKRHYRSWDKLSDEYRGWFNEHADLTAFEGGATEWREGTWFMYKDMSIATIAALLTNALELEYSLTMLCIFRHDLSAAATKAVVEILRKANEEEPLDGLDVTEDIKGLVRRALNLYQRRAAAAAKPASSPFAGMGDIENTSLGKLAKEILDDVNVDEIQSSLGDGDIFKALSSPDSGLLKLVGTVSQKMMSKMASGELRQDQLLQDAMKFAASMPGFGGGGGGPMGGFDMGNLMQMMGGMMGATGGSGATKTRVDKNKVRRHAQAQKMRDRLDKRSKENMSTHVEDEHLV